MYVQRVNPLSDNKPNPNPNLIFAMVSCFGTDFDANWQKKTKKNNISRNPSKKETRARVGVTDRQDLILQWCNKLKLGHKKKNWSKVKHYDSNPQPKILKCPTKDAYARPGNLSEKVRYINVKLFLAQFWTKSSKPLKKDQGVCGIETRCDSHIPTYVVISMING